MPKLGGSDQDVTLIQRQSPGALVNASGREFAVAIKSLLRAWGDVDGSVDQIGVHDRDVRDHEVFREDAVHVVVLGHAAWQIHVAARAHWTKAMRSELPYQVDDSALDQGLVSKACGFSGRAIQVSADGAAAAEQVARALTELQRIEQLDAQLSQRLSRYHVP
jgi:hypothetical protein